MYITKDTEKRCLAKGGDRVQFHSSTLRLASPLIFKTKALTAHDAHEIRWKSPDKDNEKEKVDVPSDLALNFFRLFEFIYISAV